MSFVRSLGAICAIAICTTQIVYGATLLERTDEIDKRCVRQFQSIGITCQRDGDPPPRIEPDNPPVAILHLRELHTPLGFAYYSGTVEAFKSGIPGRDFEPTETFYGDVWSHIRDSGLKFDAAGSEAEANFLRVNDALLSQKKARDDQAQQFQAQREFENSAAGKKAAAQQAVADCRKTISQAQHAITQDKRAARISGYENKALRYEAGVAIVNCQDLIARGGYQASE